LRPPHGFPTKKWGAPTKESVGQQANMCDNPREEIWGAQNEGCEHTREEKPLRTRKNPLPKGKGPATPLHQLKEAPQKNAQKRKPPGELKTADTHLRPNLHPYGPTPPLKREPI